MAQRGEDFLYFKHMQGHAPHHTLLMEMLLAKRNDQVVSKNPQWPPPQSTKSSDNGTTKESKKAYQDHRKYFLCVFGTFDLEKKCQNIDLFLVHSMTLDEGELLYEILEWHWHKKTGVLWYFTIIYNHILTLTQLLPAIFRCWLEATAPLETLLAVFHLFLGKSLIC